MILKANNTSYLTRIIETLEDICIEKRINNRISKCVRGRLMGKKVRNSIKELELCLVVIFILLGLECYDYVNTIMECNQNDIKG